MPPYVAGEPSANSRPKHNRIRRTLPSVAGANGLSLGWSGAWRRFISRRRRPKKQTPSARTRLLISQRPGWDRYAQSGRSEPAPARWPWLNRLRFVTTTTRAQVFLHVLHEALSDLEHLGRIVVGREPGLVGRSLGRISALWMALNDFQRCAIGPICCAGPDATQVLIVGGAEGVELGVLALALPGPRMRELLVVDVRHRQHLGHVHAGQLLQG